MGESVRSDRWIRKVIGKDADVVEPNDNDERSAWEFLSIFTHRTNAGVPFSIGYTYLSFSKSFLFESGQLTLPDMCVICGNSAPQGNPNSIRKSEGFFGHLRKGVCQIESGPKCEAHLSEDYPGIHVAYHIAKPGVTWLSCSVQSKEFLREFLLELHSGEHLPPWVVCPGLGPYISWTSGSQYEWLHHGWFPFWKQLDSQNQVEYILRWKAPQDWKEFFEDEYAISE